VLPPATSPKVLLPANSVNGRPDCKVMMLLNSKFRAKPWSGVEAVKFVTKR
jgi:hypothetical protein